MSMPNFDWLELYQGDPLLIPLRVTVGVLASALLALILAFR